jgi:hypothetical protein
VEQINPVAYRLLLPAHSTIHPVSHVSQLKPAISRHQVSASALPNISDGLQIPLRVLQRRMIQQGGSMVAQGKILWSGMDASLASWEDIAALRDQFPKAPAWGQAGSEEVADVSDSVEEPVNAGNTREENVRTVRVRRPNKRVRGPEWVE